MALVSSPSIAIDDARRVEERFPAGLDVTRSFADEQLQLSGDSATFTARLTEEAAGFRRASTLQFNRVRRQGEWQLQEAHITPDAPSGR